MRFGRLIGLALAAGMMLSGTAGAYADSDSDGRFPSARPARSGGGGFLAALFGSPDPLARQTVAIQGNYKPGTIIISTSERRLYFVTGQGQAIRYGIGVGRPGFTWTGVKHVSNKREWPGWTPPATMLKRRPDLPRHMAGGIENPLGARAMYLGSTIYRIHGSNEPETIGEAVSSGCFRMTNEDVVDLYDRVRVGAMVVIQR